MNKFMSRKMAKSILKTFTRKELRSFAHQWGLKVGKEKSDTIRNCAAAVVAGNARLCFTVMVKPNKPCANEVAESFAVKKVYSYKAERHIKRADGSMVPYVYNRV